MGPTNVALVKFYFADQAYRAALGKLDAVTRGVRVQEAKVNQLNSEYDQAHKKAMELEVKAKELELDMKSREQRIELLRQRQQNVSNNKEYQTLIIDINTQKLDKGKVEEQALGAMDTTAKQKSVASEIKTRLDAEAAKHAEMKASIDGQVKTLTAEAQVHKAPRDEAAKIIPQRAMDLYNKAADRYEGEGMAPIQKPKPKIEEYICSGCNIDLVVDIYNRLHTRDEFLLCPSCGRLLYIPEDLPLDKAIAKKKPTPKPRKPADPNAPKASRAKKASKVFDTDDAKLPAVGDTTLRGEQPGVEGALPSRPFDADRKDESASAPSEGETPADSSLPDADQAESKTPEPSSNP